MKTKPTIDFDQLQRDFDATKTIGKGKHRKVVPDARRRLRAAVRYLRWRFGPPRRLTAAELPVVFSHIPAVPPQPSHPPTINQTRPDAQP